MVSLSPDPLPLTPLPGTLLSRLEVLLEETGDGTRITLVHTDVPDGQGDDYRQGWVDSYFDPMQEYFSRSV